MVPAHAALIGRLLLGGLDRAGLEALYHGVKLADVGPNAPTTLDALASRIEAERARGYGISDSNSASSLFPRGMIAISAPVRDARGQIPAAINATTVSGAFSAAEIRGSLKDRVLAAANEISSRLGGQPARPASSRAPTRG